MVISFKRLTLIGDGMDGVAVRAASPSKDVLAVLHAEGVNITGFTVTGATNNAAGIWLWSRSHCTVSDNRALNNHWGIAIGSSSGNTIINNTVSDNLVHGIMLYSASDDNTVTSNVISDNQHGIFLTSSSSNLIYNNCLENNAVNAADGGVNAWNITKTAAQTLSAGLSRRKLLLRLHGRRRGW